MVKEFIKYPKIKALGHEENQMIFTDLDDEIVVQEKMDGANFRFMLKDGKPIFGSRTQQLTSDEGEDSNVSKNFKRCVDYVRDKISHAYENGVHSLSGKYIFFGECMVKHSLSYDWEEIPPFLGFDVYDIEQQKMLKFTEMAVMFSNLGLPLAPLVGIKKASDISKDNINALIPISKYPPKSEPKMLAEGVVFKNYTKQIYAKYVRPEFKEINAKTFGGTPKYEESDTGKICANYCTNARIEKAIFYFVDQDKPLDMTLMRMIIGYTYKDIWEEEWKSITKKYRNVDFVQMRKIIAERCKAVLQQVITNNAL